MPTEIYIMTNFYYFPDADFCRMSRFVTYVINNSSAAVFIVIAIDRYIRICHPHTKAISVSRAQIACILSLFVGFAVSWPALVLYGNKRVPLPSGRNKTGYIYGVICDVKNEMDRTPYPEAFFIYLWCAFFTCFIIITILYTLIGRVMLQRSRRRSTNSKSEASFLETSRSRMRNNDGGSIQKVDNGSSYNGVGMNSQRIPTFELTRIYENPSNGNENYTSSNNTVPSFELSRIRPSKSTLMLFAISAVFVMSFLPFLVIMKVRQHVGPAFYPTLSPSEQVVINMFSRSYLVNNCANPIVYGMCNSQFRDKVKKLFQISNKRFEPASSRIESRVLTEGL